jgi:N-acetyl sugar amidotransferase
MISSSTTIPYQMCSRSVMDNISDPDIRFDENGVCQYWYQTEKQMQTIRLTNTESEQRIEQMLADVKKHKGNSEYDCLIGVSGGVDSSYLAYLVHKWGLKPLVVHFDNGWNSELSVANIHNIVSILNFELVTYVIDWEEFRDLQRAFFKASVIDVEMLTDHAISAAMFQIAQKHRIKVVLGGSNIATESFFPKSWAWLKLDLANIKHIHRIHGEKKLKTFPMMGLLRRHALQLLPMAGLKFFTPLDYINYRKNDAMKILETDLKWRYYGGKHYESVFTKFYQAYYLPEKFKVDKRKSHLSCLIANDEITREEALAELSKPLYLPNELVEEKMYVLKKLGFSESEWQDIMDKPPVSHMEFDSETRILKTISRVRNIFRKK